MSDAALVVATLEPRTILLRDGNHPGTTASKAPHVLVIDGDQRISLVGIVNGVHALPGGRATRPKPIGHGLHGIADRSPDQQRQNCNAGDGPSRRQLSPYEI